MPHRGLAEGKSRLSGVLDDAARFELNRDLLQRTLITVTEWLRDAQQCIVVSPCSAARALAVAHGAQALLDTDTHLNNALAAGAAHARAQNAHKVLIVPGDLPLLSAAALDSLIAMDTRDAAQTTVIAPDRHGEGTNALLVNAAATPFAFGAHSFERHRALALARGDVVHTCTHQALAFDLDTPEDLDTWQHHAHHGGRHHPAPAFLEAKT